MMNRFVLTVMATNLCLTAIGQQPDPVKTTPEAAQAARNFKFEGVPLGITLKELHTCADIAGQLVIPGKPGEDPAVSRSRDHIYSGKAHWADICTYHVKAGDDRVYKMVIVYGKEKLNVLGGTSVLIEKLEKKLGKPGLWNLEQNKEPITFKAVWQFPEVGRRIVLESENDAFPNGVRLTVENTNASRELVERKRKVARAGFED